MNLTEAKAFIAEVESKLNGANPDEVQVLANGKKVKGMSATLPAKTITVEIQGGITNNPAQ